MHPPLEGAPRITRCAWLRRLVGARRPGTVSSGKGGKSSMDIALNHEGFDGRGLLLRTASLLKGPRLLLDGTELRKKGPTYLVQDNAGKEVSILVKPQLVDPVPRVEI